jgi:hypothetical protein
MTIVFDRVACQRCKKQPAVHDLARGRGAYEHICATCLDPAEIAGLAKDPPEGATVQPAGNGELNA